MKNGKLPTLGQKKILKANGLQPDNWLVVKNQPNTLEVVSRSELKRMRTGKARTRTISKSQ